VDRTDHQSLANSQPGSNRSARVGLDVPGGAVHTGKRTDHPAWPDFLEGEGEQIRDAWNFVAPLTCTAVMVTEILPYISPEFPADPLLSGVVVVLMALTWAVSRRGIGRRLLGGTLVGLAGGISAYIGTACVATGGFRSLHGLAIGVVIAVLPVLGALSAFEAAAGVVLSLLGWFLVVLSAPGEGGVDVQGLTVTALYLGLWGVLSVLAVYQSRKNRFRAFVASRRAEDLHRFAVEEVLCRHLPPSYVEQVLAGERVLDASPDRRLLTILFVDIVGFSNLTERLEAHQLTELMAGYYDLSAGIAFEHGGTIDKFIGDAVMILFGAPEEMDPDEQAVRALGSGLALQEASGQLQDFCGGLPVVLRVGIHQEVVTVGSFGGSLRVDYTVLGRGVNVAARLESECEPGRVLVSEAIHDRLPIRFRERGEVRGLLQLRGVKRPIQAWSFQRHDAEG
jgi:class 3 adenylate cyclase